MTISETNQCFESVIEVNKMTMMLLACYWKKAVLFLETLQK